MESLNRGLGMIGRREEHGLRSVHKRDEWTWFARCRCGALLEAWEVMPGRWHVDGWRLPVTNGEDAARRAYTAHKLAMQADERRAYYAAR
jgi:hypothetical protein